MRSNYTPSRFGILSRATRFRTAARSALLASVVIGCSSGGDGASNAGNNETGTGAAGGVFGGGGNGTGATAPIPVTCNNGVLDPGELCDGPTTTTCASATLNAKPNGVVTCVNCALDTSGCTTSGPGTGGMTGSGGSGGSTSAGGNQGLGGSTGVGGNVATGACPAQLPTATNCPALTNGATVQIPRANGSMMNVVIYVDPAAKSKPAPGGPLILYYHATFSNPGEVHSGFGDANIKAVTDAGGMVAAFTQAACTGCTTTDDNVWFVEDDAVQDTLVGCAIQQANIDTCRIHALGWSAGALHTMHISLARASYMASVISYSGGALGGTSNDPTNKVASILTYGDPGADVVVLDFNTNSHTYYNNYSPKGYYTMMCHHPGGHEVDPQVAPHSLEFFLAHPYKVAPEPYAGGIPADFPTYCANTPPP